jgi:ABC-type nitrate/sulfonate/bicarbonate transport system permease component
MPIVIGLVIGVSLGALAGTTAIRFVTPASVVSPAVRALQPETPTVRYFDV